MERESAGLRQLVVPNIIYILTLMYFIKNSYHLYQRYKCECIFYLSLIGWKLTLLTNISGVYLHVKILVLVMEILGIHYYYFLYRDI